MKLLSRTTAAATTPSSRVWHGILPLLLGASHHTSLPLPTAFHLSARAQSSIRRSPNLCHQCRRQMRGYTSAATAPSRDKTETAKSPPEPLRILFCGSDEFSCAALEALHGEHVRNPELIRSIDVVARPGKRTGRGYKIIQHPPIRELAVKLGLPVHERDTFTGWDMPSQTNLIIAVSFGLFVPPRLLRAAHFGGLNLHPSALPDLRGPAPLQHALLAGRTSTAITLQTLDHTTFDRGRILARSSTVSIAPDATFESLRDQVTPLAAELLVRGLKDGVYVPPLNDERVENAQGESETKLLHAPKITKLDCCVRPEHLPHLWRRYRALGPLWFYSRDRKGARRRIIIEKISSFNPSHDWQSFIPRDMPLLVDGELSSALIGYGGKLALDANRSSESGTPYLVPLETVDADSHAANTTATSHIVVWLPEGIQGEGACWIGDCRIETIKVEGDKVKPAARALRDFIVPVGAGPETGDGEGK